MFFPLVISLFFSIFFFRGPYCGGGGVEPAGSVVCQLRRKVPGLPGRHVQRRDRGSEAAVHPRAERNLYPYNTPRGPAGHGAGCVGGKNAHTRVKQPISKP